MTNTVDLWVNYKKTLDDVFPEFQFDSRWCEWDGKGDTHLTADIFTAPHFIKSRRVDIYNKKCGTVTISAFKVVSPLPSDPYDRESN